MVPSRGSAESPTVVVMLVTCDVPMPSQALLYTDMTRARRLLAIVGRTKLLYAVARDRRAPRHPALGGLPDRTRRDRPGAGDQSALRSASGVQPPSGRSWFALPWRGGGDGWPSVLDMPCGEDRHGARDHRGGDPAAGVSCCSEQAPQD